MAEGTLAEGTLAEGDACTLTCNWHNWKFDLETGAVIGGGDAVRVFPSEVRDGTVWIDIADPPAADRVARALTGLRDGFRDPSDDRIARDLARLELAGADPRLGVRAAIRWTHDRFRWGMTHAHAVLADWLALAEEQGDPVTRLACLTEIVAHLADDSLREDVYPYPEGAEPWDEAAFVAAVEAEDEERGGPAGARRAGGRRLGADRPRPVPGRTRALPGFRPFGDLCGEDPRGRTAARRRERPGRRRRRRAGGGAADAAAGAGADPRPARGSHSRVQGLPPGARGLDRPRGRAPVKPADLCRVSVAKALDRISGGSADPQRCYDALMAAAAWQLLHADPVYATRDAQPVSQNVGRLDFSHAITFANAGRRMMGRHPELAPDVLLQTACFLGRNAGYVDPGYPADRWRVTPPRGFVESCAEAVIDHGIPEFIVSAHLVKMTCAVREEIAAAPNASWVPDLAAALNRFLNEPFKRKLTRRVAYQARETVKGE